MKAGNVALSPTLYNLETDLLQNSTRLRLQPYVLEKTRALVQSLQNKFRSAMDAGVLIAGGSGFDLRRRRFGLAGGAARDDQGRHARSGRRLLAGTVASAEAIGWSDRVGEGLPGFYADLIALPREPSRGHHLPAGPPCRHEGGCVAVDNRVDASA